MYVFLYVCCAYYQEDEGFRNPIAQEEISQIFSYINQLIERFGPVTGWIELESPDHIDLDDAIEMILGPYVDIQSYIKRDIMSFLPMGVLHPWMHKD